MSTPINSLTSDFAVAPQLGPDDMAAVAAAGFKSVIINRPDFEDGPNQQPQPYRRAQVAVQPQNQRSKN